MFATLLTPRCHIFIHVTCCILQLFIENLHGASWAKVGPECDHLEAKSIAVQAQFRHLNDKEIYHYIFLDLIFWPNDWPGRDIMRKVGSQNWKLGGRYGDVMILTLYLDNDTCRWGHYGKYRTLSRSDVRCIRVHPRESMTKMQAFHIYTHVSVSPTFTDLSKKQRLGNAHPNSCFPVELHSGGPRRAAALAWHPRRDPSYCTKTINSLVTRHSRPKINEMSRRSRVLQWPNEMIFWFKNNRIFGDFWWIFFSKYI